MYIFYYNFKRSIDEMPDEDFINMISYLMFSSEDFEDEDWTFDEEWEDEVASFFILCVLPIGFQMFNWIIGRRFTHGNSPPVGANFIFL